MTEADLAPGEHSVLLESDRGSVRHGVTIEAGVTASLMVPLVATSDSALVSGWIAVSAPADVQVFGNKAPTHSCSPPREPGATVQRWRTASR